MRTVKAVKGQSGITYIEILIVVGIVSVLSLVALPSIRLSLQRQDEVELRRALREIRTALDEYKKGADQKIFEPEEEDSYGYPPDLETLVKGVETKEKKKLRFLRRIPVDPLTGKAEWGMRSYQDKPDSKRWGGENVYDVYSLSERKAIDGSRYRDW